MRWVLLSFLLCGCGKQPPKPHQPAEPAQKNCATFELLEGNAWLPSNVSLLFGVRACNGSAMAGLSDVDFVVNEDGRSVSRYESEWAIVPHGEAFDVATLLMLDMSGSIVETGSLAALQDAAIAFVGQLTPAQRIGIQVFDGAATTYRLVSFSRDTRSLTQAIESLSDYVPADPSTNLNGAVVEGLSILTTELSGDDTATGSLVVFTDGTDQAAWINAQQTIDAVQASPHAVYAIGLSGEVDGAHLSAIGKDGYEAVANAAGILAAFERTAARIDAEANRFYLLGFCSPKRAGAHVLSVSVAEYQGALDFPFDASNFGVGCRVESIVVGSD